MRRLVEALERVRFAPLFAVLFVLLGAWHFEALRDPPYWDALTGAFAQAHWQATHSFSPFALLGETPHFVDGGACVYPFSAYPPLIALLERLDVSREASFVGLHLLSVAAGAGLLAAAFLAARRALGAPFAALVTLAFAVQPAFRALVAQMNMDILLGATTLLALRALSEGRINAATAWAAAGLAVKPTGVVVVAASATSIALRLARPRLFPEAGLDRPRQVRALAAHALLLVLFVLELVWMAHAERSPPGVSLFGGTAQFLGKRLWTLPEFGAALVALLVLAPWILARAVRGRARTLEIDGLVLVLAFTGFYCQYLNVLPRYCVQVFPVVLVLLALATREWIPRRLAALAFGAYALVGLVNTHGRLHPQKRAEWVAPGEVAPRVTNDGWLLERSLAYRDDLALNQAIAARCEALRGEVVVAGWPILQLLAVPRLGYVSAPPALAAAETPLAWVEPAIANERRLEPRPPLVRVVSPNVYAGETSRVLAGDDVLETFTRGGRVAWLVRRPSDAGPARR